MRIVTFALLGIMILVYFTSLNFYNTGHDVIDYPLRSFYHADMNHLIANSISFIALSFMEEAIGSKQYLFAIFFIWIVSNIILYAIHYFFPSRKVYTVGFSGVIFGLVVIYYTLLNMGPGITFLGLAISIIPQLAVPGISWEGHIAGVIAGIIYVMLFPVKKINE